MSSKKGDTGIEVSRMDKFKERIMKEACSLTYSIRPGSTKMYCDSSEIYWLRSMKKGIEKFVAKCLIGE